MNLMENKVKYISILTSMMLAAGAAAGERNTPLKDPVTMIHEANLTGGIVVCVDMPDSEFISGFAVNDRFTVQALNKSVEAIDKARQSLQQNGVYGQVSVSAYNGTELPYIDNLVNLVVCPDNTGVPQKELLRVITPGGTLMVKSPPGWKTMVKPRPEGMDEWNQHLYGADNTGTSFDIVGPPQRMRWHNTPEYGRSKAAMPSVTSMITANGILFTIEDRATTQDVNTPQQYNLLARDAFNGIELWKKPLAGWKKLGTDSIKHMTTEVQRLMAAIGTNVYSALGYDQAIAQMNGKTGEIIQVYRETERTKEFLIADGALYGVRGNSITQAMKEAARRSAKPATTLKRELYAIDLNSGKQKWKTVLPSEYVLGTFCVNGDMIAFAENSKLWCLRASDGAKAWQTPYTFGQSETTTTSSKRSSKKRRMSSKETNSANSSRTRKSSYATLLIAEGRLFCSGGATLDAYDLATGRRLWRGQAAPNYMKTADLFFASGLIWSGNLKGLDPATGKVVRTLEQKMTGPMGHDRCWRNKITERYFINSKTGGADLINLEGKGEFPSPWIRSTCGLGPMPANNMIYTAPYVCMCSIGSMIPGFNALYCDNIDNPSAKFELTLTPRLTKGTAFGKVSSKQATPTDWPTYRGAADRGAVSNADLSADVSKEWHGNSNY